MLVRLFGGWDFDDGDVRRRDLAQIGYIKGKPMGANLGRIQIVKGWPDGNSKQQEKVYDVVWSDQREPSMDGQLPPVGNTVDLSTPSWTNTIGAPELGTVWRDPDFDPAEPAFYMPE